MGRWRKQVAISLVTTVLVALTVLLAVPTALAQEDPGEDVYTSVCQGCHQPNGAGIAGLFPPLAGNPNVQDAAYLEGVIRNGKTGEITVLGTTYNGQMPAFGAQLSDGEISAVIDYVQNRLGVAAPGEPSEPVEEGEVFPWNLVLLGSAQTVFVVGLIFFLASPAKKGELTWWNAYGRAILIFLFFVLATTWFPSWVLSQEIVAGAPRWVSDVAGSGAWLIPLAVGVVALRWLQKTERI